MKPIFMEYFFSPTPTKKEIPRRFNGLEPKKGYEPIDVLGNYEWLISCHTIFPVSEGLKNEATAKSKLGKVSFDESNMIPFQDFFSFLVKNYRGWAPYAKGMETEKAKACAHKLIESFLSCSPEEAVYVRYDGAEEIPVRYSHNGLTDEPMFVHGVIGVFDTQNLEFFQMTMGGYENNNPLCYGKIVSTTLPQIIFCPIRKMPIQFHAYEFMNFNQNRTEEVGNYDWYLYQYKIEKNSIDFSTLEKKEGFRTNIPPVGTFTSSSIEPFQDFFSFLVKNYRGWAPYAKGMETEKAKACAHKLIESFLSCSPEEAVYVRYDGAEEITDPHLVSGVHGIIDPVHNEFFELIMGGND